MGLLLIKNGTLVSGGREWKSDLLVKDGKIAEIGEHIAVDNTADCIDAQNCYVFPGFIDPHTHLDMSNGVTVTADDFDSGTRAALSGGTTSIIDFATQEKSQSLREALSVWHKKAEGKSSCNYGFHMAITDWNSEAGVSNTPSQLDQMLQEGVSSLKVYMAYDALKLSDDKIFDMMREAKKREMLICNHCENGDIINFLIADKKTSGDLSVKNHPDVHPEQIEAEAAARYLYLASLADVPVYIVHLSTKKALEEVMLARSRNQKFYVETCPHYLSLNSDVYKKDGFESATYVCSPPIRSSENGDALWAGMKEIQTIATDHCSFNIKGQKDMGIDDFSKIPNGMPGLEHRPAVVFTKALSSKKDIPYTITPAKFSQLMGENAAKIFGMYPERGSLEKGSVADITVWDPKAEWKITAQTQIHAVDNTPYEGFEACGRAKYVVLGGEVCAENGKILQTGKGRFVKRHAGFADI